jgi:hypothetical protein
MDYRINLVKNNLLCFKFLLGISSLQILKILLNALNIKIMNQMKMYSDLLKIINNLNQLQEKKLKANIKFITKFTCILEIKKNKKREYKNNNSN